MQNLEKKQENRIRKRRKKKKYTKGPGGTVSAQIGKGARGPFSQNTEPVPPSPPSHLADRWTHLVRLFFPALPPPLETAGDLLPAVIPH
jgi:hypothetical protein